MLREGKWFVIVGSLRGDVMGGDGRKCPDRLGGRIDCHEDRFVVTIRFSISRCVEVKWGDGKCIFRKLIGSSPDGGEEWRLFLVLLLLLLFLHVFLSNFLSFFSIFFVVISMSLFVFF